MKDKKLKKNNLSKFSQWKEKNSKIIFWIILPFIASLILLSIILIIVFVGGY